MLVCNLLPVGKTHVTILVAGKQKSGFPVDSLRWIGGAFSHECGQIKRIPHALTKPKENTNWLS